MSDYIERVAFIEKCIEVFNGIKGNPKMTNEEVHVIAALHTVCEIINDMPAADVVPMDFHERCLQIEIENRLALEKKYAEVGNWWKMFGALAEMVKSDSVKNVTPKTNADEPRAMTDEELAEWLADVLFHCSNTICDERCPMYKCCCDQPSDNILDWLRQEAAE